MPRSVEEIQNDIAKVKAEIALKNKYMNGYSAPTSNRGWGAYFQGDKSVHQKALDEQTAWANNELNRALQEKLARINSDKPAVKSEADLKREAREKMRDQMELEQAQADYDAAMDALDSDNPQTALAAHRAGIKLSNLYRMQNPDMTDEELRGLMMMEDTSLDPKARTTYVGKSSPRVTKNREITSLTNTLDSIFDRKGKGAWTDPEKEKALEAHKRLEELDSERAKKYDTSIFNQGDTDETKAKAYKTLLAAYKKALKGAGDSAAKRRKVKETYKKKGVKESDL